MKKVFVSLLAATMFFSLVGCELGTPPKNSVVGKWECEADWTDLMQEAVCGGMDGLDDYVEIKDFEITLIAEFDDDGSAKYSVDEDSAEEAYEAMYEEVMDGMKEMFADMAEEEGCTLDELFEASGYDSADDFWKEIEEDMKSSFSAEDFIDEFEQKGEYLLEDDKLYFGDDVDEEKENETYEIIEFVDENTFKLTEAYEDGEVVEDDGADVYPMTFKKVK